MVGVAGFEPTTLCPPDKCATRLRYTPTGANPYRTRVFLASGNFTATGEDTAASAGRCKVREKGQRRISQDGSESRAQTHVSLPCSRHDQGYC